MKRTEESKRKTAKNKHIKVRYITTFINRDAERVIDVEYWLFNRSKSVFIHCDPRDGLREAREGVREAPATGIAPHLNSFLLLTVAQGNNKK